MSFSSSSSSSSSSSTSTSTSSSTSTSTPLSSRILQGEILLLDGGLASELERMGADLKHVLWSARLLKDSPSSILQVHQRYLSSGADIITSATYQASPQGFLSAGFSQSEGKQLMKLGVQLAKQARDCEKLAAKNQREIYVAASFGSYGAVLCNGGEFSGEFGEGIGLGELLAFHLERLEILVPEGPDLLLFETIPSRLEARAIRAALEKFEWGEATKIPVAVSFSCRDGLRAGSGETLADCIQELLGLDGLVALGVNCTSPEFVEELLRGARDRMEEVGCRVPLLCYPNSGERWSVEQRCYLPGPQDHLEGLPGLARRLLEAKLVNIFGGCCRTTPELIALVAKEIKVQRGSITQ